MPTQNLTGEIIFSSGTEIIRGPAFIGSTDLQALLSGKLVEKNAPFENITWAAEGKGTNPGGAPIRYDWDAMWIEVVRIFYTESDPPLVPRALRKRLHDWFSETNRRVPGETMMKKKMKALFEAVKIRRQDTN